MLRACVEHPPKLHGDYLFCDCLVFGDYPEAAARFARIAHGKNPNAAYFRLAKAHIARGQRDGAQQVRNLVGDLVFHSSSFISRSALTALCLACTEDELEDCANSILGQFEDENYGSDELWREADCIRYFAGQINEDELIQLAHNHRYTLAMFHCSIAFKSFARGERQRAREHFQLAVDTDTIGSSDYDIALAYLTRMKADETWPQWLKEDHEK